MSLLVKFADTPEEFEQIHRMNHETFAEEIPQHARNPEGRLIDRFHSENRYLICLDGSELVGMVALRDRRPFSLDAKLPDLDRYLRKRARAVEIRLLSVKPRKRRGPVFGLLMRGVLERCLAMDYEVGLISGRIENVPLYGKFGFRPFGPRVGGPGAWYQPMRIDRSTLNRHLSVFPSVERPRKVPIRMFNFLPGPVAHTAKVREAFSSPAYSHRSERYDAMLAGAETLLLEMTGARGVSILNGTGTLANEAVGGQLSLRPGRGLVLSNGEFGERLIGHAAGWRLRHTPMRWEWGTRIDLGAVARTLESDPDVSWIWAVHCETSTGILNPIGDLKDLCAAKRVSLCLDCISSIGAVPVDLEEVDLASAVSGKALGAFTGLAIVFHRDPPVPAPQSLPCYLDLGRYTEAESSLYSGSSNLLSALEASLMERRGPAFSKRIAFLSRALRERLRRAGVPVLFDGEDASPAILTVPLPASIPSLDLGSRLERSGILLNYQGRYLSDRNWIQIGVMADHEDGEIEAVAGALADAFAEGMPETRIAAGIKGA